MTSVTLSGMESRSLMISAAREYVVDAHTLIWYVADSPRLGAHAGAAMDDPSSVLLVPVIALAEACWAVERGRTDIPSVASLLSRCAE
jgi:PIN domain nuclease of toxin-antitoxin system